MRTMSGLGLSLVFALAGAAVWVGLSQVWDLWLLVVLACAVGGLAGFGMGIGSRAKGGVGHGLLAACVCLVACLAAKGAIAYFRATEFVEDYATVGDEDVLDHIATQTFYAMAEDGRVSEDDLDGGYPPVVMSAAQEQFDSMSREEVEEYKAAMQAEWDEVGGVTTGMVSTLAFLFSWRLIDIICVCSAVGTAFKIGSFHKPEESQEIPAWATGAASATGNPLKPAATDVGTLGAVVTPAGGTLPMAPSATGGASIKRGIAGKSGSMTMDQPEDAASSFWTKLGSEPPARNTPSLRRDPKPASGDGATREAA